MQMSRPLSLTLTFHYGTLVCFRHLKSGFFQMTAELLPKWSERLGGRDLMYHIEWGKKIKGTWWWNEEAQECVKRKRFAVKTWRTERTEGGVDIAQAESGGGKGQTEGVWGLVWHVGGKEKSKWWIWDGSEQVMQRNRGKDKPQVSVTKASDENMLTALEGELWRHS